ncbi:chemotaxis protein CheA [Geobacter anodireducens]
MDMSQYRDLFVAEAREHLERLGEGVLALEKDPANGERLDSLFRTAHSIKGMAGSMGYDGIADLSHCMEDLMDRVRRGRIPFGRNIADLLLAGADLLGRMVEDVAGGGNGALGATDLCTRLARVAGQAVNQAAAEAPSSVQPSDQQPEPARRDESDGTRTVRIRSELLDRFVSITGELVTGKNRIMELAAGLDSEPLRDAATELSKLVRDLQHEVMSARMMPFGTICDRFPRMVRDLARRSGKEATLVIDGKDQELDRGILEILPDPLLHALRNAVDHGIESPEERTAAGKGTEGRIVLSVRRGKGYLDVTVTDDGRGMDPTALADAALAKGIITPGEAAELSRPEALMLVCRPGFSTARSVTEVSGRGVGMDAVQAAVSRAGGSLFIQSERGRGSRITLRLPLSVAIIQVLLVGCGPLTVAVPVNAVRRTIELDRRLQRIEDGRAVFDLGGETLPLVDLGLLVGTGPTAGGELSPVLAADVAGRTVGFSVDRFFGQAEVFAKPLGTPLSRARGLAGGAILGDGRVIFILDLPYLVDGATSRRRVSMHPDGAHKGGTTA